jgi:hypothetical protein
MSKRYRAVVAVDTKCRQVLDSLAAEITQHYHLDPPVTARELIEALTHYCASVLRRPDTRDGSSVFDFANYGEGGNAEKWF